MNELKSTLADGPMLGEPLVSVSVITYNHGKYIRQCLDGILMQKVNFPYEILIHDDASPDDTADIIREYEAKYPTVIKPIYQTVNQYSQGKDVGRFNYDRAVGKYIALCEGDDYWTDPEKLWKQINVLEKNTSYSGTAHSYKIIDENSDVIHQMDPIAHVQGWYSIDDIRYYRVLGATASILFRNYFKTLNKQQLDDFYNNSGHGDQKLWVLLCLYGNIYYFEEIMSTYRYITTGSTSYQSQAKNKNQCEITYRYLLDQNDFAIKYYNRDLEIYPCALGVMGYAIFRFVQKPSTENKQILQHILLITITRKYLKLYVTHTIKHPIKFMKTLLIIIRERRERWRILALTKKTTFPNMRSQIRDIRN